MKLWEKGVKLNKLIENFTVGEDYLLDQKLVKYDCEASIAHAKMLGKIEILKSSEVKKIVSELQKIISLDEKGKFKISKAQEDVHTAIEEHLTKKLGEIGKKIHTARSRNDQVLTALRLYYKDELLDCKSRVGEFSAALKRFIKKHRDVKFPGYTHSRKAMPSSIPMYGNAFVDSMSDNLKLLDAVLTMIDQSPLGTAAGYGVSMKIDRELTTKLLKFGKVQNNPIYTQMSRGKFESSIVHLLSQIMFDLNKFATDLVLFSMPEFGYFELPPELSTGSSIMPQKKNPDVLELVRAKYHVVISNEFQLKSLTYNLMSGYHRDLQLTKKPVMESLEVTKGSLSVMTLVISKLKVDKLKCEQSLTDEIFATEEVYKLVKNGVSFREAYKKVAKKY